mgnify:CR=1 FL=1
MSTITLDKLPLGKVGVIVQLSPNAAPFRRKFLSMGITPGCKVSVIRSAPLGDPLEIEMRGFHLCLRRAEAATINVTECEVCEDCVL